jgi:large subunit ribosomal protein L22
MEAKAVVRHVRMSPRKMRVVANLVRGRSVEEAMGLLKVLPKKGAGVIRKLLISAVANAEQQGEVDVDKLTVKSLFVDGGPILKRWMPRSMGRANRIQRRTSHVTVVVAEN